MSTKTEAQRLADVLEQTGQSFLIHRRAAADVLRAQEAEITVLRAANAELLVALTEICNEAEVFGGGFGGWISDKAHAAITKHNEKGNRPA